MWTICSVISLRYVHMHIYICTRWHRSTGFTLQIGIGNFSISLSITSFFSHLKISLTIHVLQIKARILNLIESGEMKENNVNK